MNVYSIFANHMFVRNLAVFILLAVAFSACKKDFFEESGPGVLTFSNDSILFDTVFASVGSTTQKFIVYNPNSNPVTVESIRLLNTDPNNVYRINIDGQPLENSQNIRIASQDSMFVFVEVTINPSSASLPFLVTNQLEFKTNNQLQTVELVAYGQNAHFYTPMDNLFISENDTFNFSYFSIAENTIWTNDLPHVIYGYVIVEPSATLTIEEGTNLYFHQNSGIIVGNPLYGAANDGGTLIVNGKLDNEVIFQGDRLEEWYADAPGQWSQIWMTQGSTNNSIDYAIIRNATVGIKVDTVGNSTNPTLSISNTIIENMSDIGLFAQGSHIVGYNNVVKNCGRYALVLNIGGDYEFTHCTFANFFPYGGRNTPSILLNNYYEDINGNVQIRDLNRAHFTNCIIDGNLDHELELQNNPMGNFNYLLDHCIIQLARDSSITDYNQQNSLKIENQMSIFEDVNEENFHLSDQSPAVDAGKLTPFMVDIEGQARDEMPDVGAYEKID